MDLWIRSQDRTTLIKSNEIYISENEKDSYVIMAKETSHILGAYKTIERALEVLDEIHNILSPVFILKNFNPLDVEEIKKGKVPFLKNNAQMSSINSATIENVNSTYVYTVPKE